MTPERFKTIQRVLQQRQVDLTIVTDEVHKGRNLSALMRTCDAVGIDQMHCVTPKNGFRAYRGTDLGTNKWVTANTWDDVSKPLAMLQGRGYQVVAAHLSDSAVDYRCIDFTRPTALVLGAEKEGVSNEVLAGVDQHIIIPMMGMVESFNVSVACAIILAEAQRQRAASGMYDHCWFSPRQYKERLFRWCQPTIAGFCDTNNLAFPELDDEGDVAEASNWYASVKGGTAPPRN